MTVEAPAGFVSLADRQMVDLRSVGELVPKIGGSLSAQIEFLRALETMSDYVPALRDAIEAAVNVGGCTAEQAS